MPGEPAGDDLLLPQYLTGIEKEYVQATARGICDPVMVVLDMRNKKTKEFAVSIFGSDEIEQQIVQSRYEKIPPVLIFAWPRDKAAIGLADKSGIEHMAEFAAAGLMTIFIWSHRSYRWISAPRPNDIAG